MGPLRQLIVFDLIGTLFDAKPSYVRAFQKACEAFDLPFKGHEAQVYEAIGNKRLSEIVADVFPDFPDERFSVFQKECNNIRDHEFEDYCEPFPHALQALRELHDKGYGLAIITGTSRSGADTLVRKYGLEDIIPAHNIQARDLVAEAHIDVAVLKNQQLWRLQKQNPGSFITLVGDSTSDRNAAEFMFFDFWAFVPEDGEDAKILAEMSGKDRVVASYAEFMEKIRPAVNYSAPGFP